MADDGADDGADAGKDATRAVAEAVAWHLRLRGADGGEWLAFTAWLEADAAHARAYDELTRAEAELDDALVPPDWSGHALPVAANDDRVPPRRRRAWGAVGGLAAAALAGIALSMPEEPAAAARIVETPAGVHRTVTLADGSRIDLNGGTRLTIDGEAGRLVTLERGEAIFRVTHDAARPFVVRSGTMRLQDIGTVFNVTRVGPHLGVQVAEGAVLFQPDRDRIMLTAGAALSHVDGGAPRMSGIAIGDVGGWREGRLVFQQTPVRLVAAALARSTGATVDVSAALADTPFTGSIRATGAADGIVPRAAALIGARAVRKGAGHWTLVGGGHARP